MPQTDVGRRRFLTFLVAAPVLTVGAKLVTSGAAAGSIPSTPQAQDAADLGDVLILACKPTENNVLLEVGEDGVVRLFLHRTEVGQGLTTAMGMLVAEEMDIPLSQVEVPLRDADPELIFNQFTGGSANVRTLYDPVRRAAAGARERLKAAAAREWNTDAGELSTRDGMVVAPDGRTLGYGSLTAAASALASQQQVSATPKAASEQGLVGKPVGRIDAKAIVTGQQKYTMDLDVPGAKPTMVRRAPTIGGTPNAVRNADAVRGMPGVSDVVVIPTGVAVVAETFGQAWDGVQALRVEWNAGPTAGLSDSDIEVKLRDAALPLAVPAVGEHMDFEFYWHFVSHAPLEVNGAVADVRSDSAEIWSVLKIPIIALQKIAGELGLPEDKVTVHVMQGGGSFGRTLYHDAAMEAAQVSQAVGHPVKLMWHRYDDTRHGRARPASFQKARVTFLGEDVLSYEHRVSGVQYDGSHGFGEILTATVAENNNAGVTQTIFHTLVHCPYDFGVVTELLEETDLGFNTGWWRNPYSNVTRVVEEIMVDEIAAKMGKDPVEFRRQFLASDRNRAVLDLVAKEGNWGRQMPAGHAQGIAVHDEMRSHSAWLVEIDATDPRNPRVYKAIGVIDTGHPINPSGIEQQMLGGLNDGISTVLQAGMHIKDGLPLEASFADLHFARQRHYPPDAKIIVMPSTTGEPGGVGEHGVSGAAGAVANAYARATGTKPRRFPINFDVDFEPVPR